MTTQRAIPAVSFRQSLGLWLVVPIVLVMARGSFLAGDSARAASAGVALSGAGVALQDDAREGGRLNLLVILVDDLGWSDLGCYGSPYYETPNLDRLATQGTRFTHAYAACPVCSPTRAALMTGQWPQRSGITDYLGAVADPAKWSRNTVALPAAYATRLTKGTPTLASCLKARGYRTFFAGKWHLGPEGHWPEDFGFDINKGGIDRGGPYGGKRYFSPYGNPRLEDGPPGEHLPDRLASETIRFINASRDQPFLAYLSFYSVHTPLMARPDLQAKAEAKRERLGLKEEWGREFERDVRLSQTHAVYAAMVEAMDLAVGRVLDHLEESGLSDSTVVIFTSDNGGLSTSEGWPTSNLPLRAGKGWIYEGGIRVPFLVRWPGLTTPGSLRATPVCSPDLMPTVIEAAGGNHDRETQEVPIKMDGRSLVPLLRDPQGDPVERDLCWHYPHYGNQGGAPASAIRRGDWKLIEWLEDRRIELYNVVADPGETRDLAADHPERVADLQARLNAWRDEVGARFPTPNPKYDPNQPSGRAANRPVK